MEIRVNGERRALDDGATVADLLAASGIAPGTCAVAVNVDFVPRSAYAQAVLREDDEVEIVTPRQGG